MIRDESQGRLSSVVAVPLTRPVGSQDAAGNVQLPLAAEPIEDELERRQCAFLLDQSQGRDVTGNSVRGAGVVEFDTEANGLHNGHHAGGI